MAVDANAAIFVGQGLVYVVFHLPEAAAEEAGLTGVDCADADASELRVSAAGDDETVLGKPR
ncbi:MAG: hypothetical protein R2881_04300 [Eubacteriales bacterium]